MAVAKQKFLPVAGGVCAPKGFAAAGVRAGIKKSGNPDVALLVCTTGNAITAGVFTTNVVRAPCVDRNEAILKQIWLFRALVVNAGNANAGNGPRGFKDNDAMARAAAKAVGCTPSAVLTASTGVIGTPMPTENLLNGIAAAAKELAATTEGATAAAQAIMTTDLTCKEYAVEFEAAGVKARVGGMAKGSGMIAPNMATMLAFLTTDFFVDPELLDAALRSAVAVSFNCLTVDGDTSTNDSCIVLSSFAARNPPVTDTSDPAYATFTAALTEVCVYLAKEVARDGEGATKLVTIRVTDAPNDTDARKVAKTIAESPLVKTALFGNDPNWGRILAAAGRAGVSFDPNQATADLAGTRIYAQGVPAPFDAAALSQAMKVKELDIAINLGTGGGGTATFYTCDFSYDYVRINAEYHT